MEGDFGRPKTYSLLGVPLDAAYWVADSPHALSQMVSPTTYSPTPAEEEMYKTAYRLRVQPHNLLPLKAAYSPQTSYAGNLKYKKHTYGPARMGNIEQELSADHQALNLFAAAARQVLAADRERMYVLLGNDDFLTRGDKRNGRNRVRRNCAFIAGTLIDLDRRISAYQYAIDRAHIETPGRSPFAVENSLNHLRDRGASLQYEMAEICRGFDLKAGFRHRPPRWGKKHRAALRAHQRTYPIPAYPPPKGRYK